MIGQFVTSKAGHDKGTLYVVTAEEGDFVYLCDGRFKRLNTPKKKRRIHIQPVNRTVEKELLERLSGGGKVQDEEIKYAIKQYVRQDY
ncbi:MAG: KOW domain-containing RNA-binding protein [Acetatifactor sp.]|nr:KOW domain-containing RNA-binding protein [Acetatifactor sp.]